VEQQETMKVCTFKPEVYTKGTAVRRVVAKRKKQAAQISPSATTYDLLYDDADKRRRRQAEYQRWFPQDCTFKPDVSTSHKFFKREDREAFLERLVTSRKNFEARLHEERAAAQEEEDQESGRPRILRKKGLGERNKRGMPIGEYLFASRYEYELMKEQMQKAEANHIKQLSSMRKIAPTSEKMSTQFRRRKLTDLFAELDGEGDGLLKPETTLDALERLVGEGELDEETAQDVFNALRDQDGPVPLGAFLALMEDMLEANRIGPRQYLLPENKHREQEPCAEQRLLSEGRAFNPEIDDRSRDLVLTRQLPPGKTLFDHLTTSSRSFRVRREEAERRLAAVRRQNVTGAAVASPKVGLSDAVRLDAEEEAKVITLRAQPAEPDAERAAEREPAATPEHTLMAPPAMSPDRRSETSASESESDSGRAGLLGGLEESQVAQALEDEGLDDEAWLAKYGDVITEETLVKEHAAIEREIERLKAEPKS